MTRRKFLFEFTWKEYSRRTTITGAPEDLSPDDSICVYLQHVGIIEQEREFYKEGGRTADMFVQRRLTYATKVLDLFAADYNLVPPFTDVRYNMWMQYGQMTDPILEYNEIDWEQRLWEAFKTGIIAYELSVIKKGLGGAIFSNSAEVSLEEYKEKLRKLKLEENKRKYHGLGQLE